MVVGLLSKAAVEAAVPEQEATQVPVLEEVDKRSAPERVVDCVRCGIRSRSSSSSWVSAAERAERGLRGIRTRRARGGGPNPKFGRFAETTCLLASLP